MMRSRLLDDDTAAKGGSTKKSSTSGEYYELEEKDAGEVTSARGKECMTVGFGSCIMQELPDLDAVHTMNSLKPDVIALLGDTVYLDEKFKPGCPKTLCCYRMGHCGSLDYSQPKDRKEVHGTWLQLMSRVQFSKAAAAADGKRPAVLATWDDHDYGWDNAKRKNRLKHDTREAFLEFFRAENKHRSDVTSVVEFLANDKDRGVHYYNDQATVLSNGDVIRVRFVMLDARWYRKRYDILGDVQKKWLVDVALGNGVEEMDWVVIGSGSAFLLGAGLGEQGYDEGTRKWLLEQLDTAGIRKRSIILSGDVHFSMILEADGGYPPEYVASSFTHSLDCCLFNCAIGAFLRDDQPNACLRRVCCCCKPHIRGDTLKPHGTAVDSRVYPQTWCCGLWSAWCGLCGPGYCNSYLHTATNENGFGWMQMTKEQVLYEYRDAKGEAVLRHTLRP